MGGFNPDAFDPGAFNPAAFEQESSGGGDTTPDAFSFTDQTDVELSTVVTSDAITVAGIDTAAEISVTGGEYSINGGAFTSSPDFVVAGDEIRARHTSSGSFSTAVDTVVDIGGVSDTFTSTTRDDVAAFVGPNIGSRTFVVDVPISPIDYASRFTGPDLAFEVVGDLPAGLSLNSAGVLSGTPTDLDSVAGLIIRATDENAETADSNAFTVNVVAELPVSEVKNRRLGFRLGLGI